MNTSNQHGQTNCLYDVAIRLIEAGAVGYTWDDNGNLLSDGVGSYSYDSANRLTGLTQGGVEYSFAYNGFGDRLQQTADAVTTNYTLDLNTGLTQVLADGATTYLYGLTRIGEYDGEAWLYHLPDALGSVRQLVVSSGAITYSHSFEPYGDPLDMVGESATNYGFAGEWTDPSGLVYLRARYYAPSMGLFLQPDPFEGFADMPASYHPYQYAFNNSVLYTDPSGKTPLLAIAVPALIGGLAGFAGGIAVGGTIGAVTYTPAVSGKCGCEMQLRAQSMTRSDWIKMNALAGGIIGGAAGIIAGFGPLGVIVVGGAATLISVADIVSTVKIIKNETGWTACTAGRIVLNVIGMVFGSAAVIKGIRAWQASGSGLRWVANTPIVIGKDALDNMYAVSRPGRGWDVREVPGGNALDYFTKIVDLGSIGPHPNPTIAAQGGLRGTLPGGKGQIYFRPITVSGNPAIETYNIPGYQINWKYHFPPR